MSICGSGGRTGRNKAQRVRLGALFITRFLTRFSMRVRVIIIISPSNPRCQQVAQISDCKIVRQKVLNFALSVLTLAGQSLIMRI